MTPSTPKTDRPEPKPGPITAPDEATHVTRARSLPVTSDLEALPELAALMAHADTAAMQNGGRRLDYAELAGLSLGFWLRRALSRSDAQTEADVSVPSRPSRSPRGAHTARESTESEGGAG